MTGYIYFFLYIVRASVSKNSAEASIFLPRVFGQPKARFHRIVSFLEGVGEHVGHGVEG